MKKILAVLFIFGIGWHYPLEAILPPLWQDVREIQAILADNDLSAHLDSGESILDIKKTEEGYVIITNKKEHPIRVIYKPMSRPGPMQFEIEFGQARPVSSP